MKKPKMILFDYGQTLVDEETFNGVKGTDAVLQYATKNKYGYTAKEVQAVADTINRELGRFGTAKMQAEIPSHMFTAYLYESMGIELSLTSKEIDRIFWDAASPGTVTDGLQPFLLFLQERDIRSGVISNITYNGEVVRERIDKMLPMHNFEFIIATSEYLFRKPNRKIFELALEKADLRPEEVWYIGDSYENDVCGAQNAGLFPVHYLGASTDTLPEQTDVLTVSHWRELTEILKKMKNPLA